jgi:hypothetical protein
VSELFADPEPAKHTYVQVALNLPLRREFTYALPAGIEARPGNRVRVNFHGRSLGGVVTAVGDTTDLPPAKVKAIESLLDDELTMPPSLLELARRMAVTYGCSFGEALDSMLPAVAKRRSQRRIPHVQLKAPHDLALQAIAELEDKHQEQSRVLRTVLEFGGPMPTLDVRRRTGTSDSPWQTLCKNGLLQKVMLAEELEELVPAAEEAAVRHQLNEHQQKAVDMVATRVRAREHRTFLLHGVTGSGKTEVYLRILEEVRNAGRSAIVLVPEISLTPQTVGRFASRFPDVAVLHSGLTDAERGRQWQRLLQGKAKIAVGARSALFAPVQDLGLIVVDEEHETSFKQDSTPRYHAREMAIVRGEIEKAVVVLGSATPTLESIGKARRGIYELLTLPQRAGAGRMPKIVVQDLRGEPKEVRRAGVVLSRTLLVMMEERLKAKDQVLLFLNRRGFAPVLLCPGCGEAVKCEHCSVSMTWHARRAARLPLVLPREAPPGDVPDLPARRHARARRRHRTARAGGQGALPRGDHGPHGRRHDGRTRRPRTRARRVPQEAHRRADRHADDRQGPRLPRRHAGRRGVRRHRPVRARLPRRRAHVPAAAPGRRARRPRREGRHGGDPDLLSRQLRGAGGGEQRLRVVRAAGARLPQGHRLPAVRAAAAGARRVAHRDGGAANCCWRRSSRCARWPTSRCSGRRRR